jgi:2-desacetyl-2-hydroxyethyl bacteriochlorophyllide A dehydrogenase
MRQAVMTAPGNIQFRDVPDAAAGPGQVLLRVRRIGICGSDVHVWHGRHPFTGYPIVQGHEFSGTVEALGEGVGGVPLGAKATARPQIVCGDCPPCARGDYNICDHLKVEGFQAPGCAQDLFAVDLDRLMALPGAFTFEQGAMIEPLAVAVRASGRTGHLDGRRVVVLGAGTIGNLVAQMCRCRGANVLVTDLSAFRLDVARRCGIEATSDASSETLADASARVFGPAGFDVALDCAGADDAITQAVDSVNKGGSVVIVAVYSRPVPLALATIGDRELHVLGSLMYRHCDYEEAVARVAAGDVLLEPLDSKHFPFEQFPDAYRFIDGQGPMSLKVFIDL